MQEILHGLIVTKPADPHLYVEADLWGDRCTPGRAPTGAGTPQGDPPTGALHENFWFQFYWVLTEQAGYIYRNIYRSHPFAW